MRPISYTFPTLGTLAANGSSATGQCSTITLNIQGTSTCGAAASSVLFDENIPRLTGLDGDTWAKQHLILYQPDFAPSSFNLDLNIFPSLTIRRAEVVLFNCPQWGIGAESIQIEYFDERRLRFLSTETVHPTVLSCTSLLRVCIPLDYPNTLRQIRMHFSPFSGAQQAIHIAEIAFYYSSPCPAFFTTLPGNSSSPNPGKQVWKVWLVSVPCALYLAPCEPEKACSGVYGQHFVVFVQATSQMENKKFFLAREAPGNIYNICIVKRAELWLCRLALKSVFLRDFKDSYFMQVPCVQPMSSL